MKERKFQVGVKALIRNNKGEILLLKANEKNFQFAGKAYWDLPGGRIKELGIQDTLKEEIKEETGVRSFKIPGIFDAIISNIKNFTDEDVSWMLLVYNCKIGKGKIRLSDEHSEYKWTTIKEAKKLLAYKYPKSFIDKLH